MVITSGTADVEAIFAELNKLPIGRDVDSTHLRSLAEIAQFEQYAAGTVLQVEADRICNMQIVLEGRIALTLPVPGSDSAAVSTISRGEMLGWSCLLGTCSARVRATAVKPTRTLSFPSDRIEVLLESDHEVGYHLMRHALSVVNDRLSDAYVQLLDLYGARS